MRTAFRFLVCVSAAPLLFACGGTSDADDASGDPVDIVEGQTVSDEAADLGEEQEIAIGGPSPDDADGCEAHPAVSRYPGTVLAWCATDNYSPFKIPLGPVTGYRTIGEWDETAGRVTRNFFTYAGEDRSHGEIYLNYLLALKQAGFEILGEGMFPIHNTDNAIGGRNWQGVYFTTNHWQGNGPVDTLAAGTSSSGGSGAIIARKRRVDGPMWVVVNLERHSAAQIGVLVDVIEAKEAETGLIVANAEAMGKDLEDYGRTVIEGLMFDHDKASLQPASKPSLDEAAKLLKSLSGKAFYVVGHTDSAGTYAYNTKLSSDRAATVRKALVEDYGIKPDRLQALGVGPVSPVFTNASDGGKEKNRRVELVEK